MEDVFFNRKTQRTDRQKLLIVEGVDDALFLDQMLLHMDQDPATVGVCYAGGKDKLSAFLIQVKKSGPFTTGLVQKYAIIRDVDDSVQTCSAEISQLFSAAGEPQPEPGATTIREDGRGVGLYLIPAHQTTGSLENLVLASVDGHALMQPLESYLNSSVAAGGPSDHLGKRRAQAFLAAAAQPLCNGVGYATKRAIFDVGHDTFAGLRNFLADFLA